MIIAFHFVIRRPISIMAA